MLPRFPTPDSRLPTPDSRLPTPDSPLSTPFKGMFFRFGHSPRYYSTEIHFETQTPGRI
ncbi:hypothetical protein [Moorena sp. SIO3E8]|uniref:hypothetical protein n=1 Tax=Moorena sp. SIO3E8 TaxID=2607830 RepID=UPI0014189385|nr:hypothetical protein [Moorena sp. SIO3E8]NEO17710.1 hypothetical protein [Moorena sp. SIO3E8]